MTTPDAKESTTPAGATRRIGVLGGTFDPPHLGHLLIAQEALSYLGLNRVLFAPAQQPPHKLGQKITPVEHRVEMVRLAIAGNPRLALSRVDVDRAGPTYTVDMLALLQEEWGPNTQLYFIMGMDSLANILSWRKPERIIYLCWLAVFNRPGFSADLTQLERQLPGLTERVILIPAPVVDIAASDLQHRIRAHEPYAHLVPPAVAAYIQEHRLYMEN